MRLIPLFLLSLFFLLGTQENINGQVPVELDTDLDDVGSVFRICDGGNISRDDANCVTQFDFKATIVECAPSYIDIDIFTANLADISGLTTGDPYQVYPFPINLPPLHLKYRNGSGYLFTEAITDFNYFGTFGNDQNNSEYDLFKTTIRIYPVELFQDIDCNFEDDLVEFLLVSLVTPSEGETPKPNEDQILIQSVGLEVNQYSYYPVQAYSDSGDVFDNNAFSEISSNFIPTYNLAICIPCSSCTAPTQKPKDGLLQEEEGIEQRSFISSDVTISPNPFSAYLDIEIPASQSSKGKLKIYNFSGKEVLKHSFYLDKGNNSIQLNTENLTTGAYILVIETDEYQAIEKLMK